MTLIDLDKVRWKEGFYDMHTGEQFAPMMFNTPEWLEWATAEAKVKAIPIEFIEAFKKEFRAVASVKAVIDWLLEKWEKENEHKESD